MFMKTVITMFSKSYNRAMHLIYGGGAMDYARGLVNSPSL